MYICDIKLKIRHIILSSSVTTVLLNNPLFVSLMASMTMAHYYLCYIKRYCVRHSHNFTSRRRKNGNNSLQGYLSYILKRKKPLKIKDFCVRAQFCFTIMFSTRKPAVTLICLSFYYCKLTPLLKKQTLKAIVLNIL